MRYITFTSKYKDGTLQPDYILHSTYGTLYDALFFNNPNSEHYFGLVKQLTFIDVVELERKTACSTYKKSLENVLKIPKVTDFCSTYMVEYSNGDWVGLDKHLENWLKKEINRYDGYEG